MQTLFTQENICAIVIETMMAQYAVGDNDELEDNEQFFNDKEGFFIMEISEWLKSNSSGIIDSGMYWIESYYRRGNTCNGIVADAYEIPGLLAEGKTNQEVSMKLHIAALEVFNARYVYGKLPSRNYEKKIKFEDYDFIPKYFPEDIIFSELSAWLNQEEWNVIYDKERYNRVIINLNSNIVFAIPRTIDDMVSRNICELVSVYVGIDKINKTDPGHVNRVWAQRLSKRILDRSRSKSKLSSTTGFSRWTCDVCDGDSSTGCLFYDPTECPR